MKHIVFLSALLLMALATYAKPVDISTAQIVAKHQMMQKGWITNADQLTLCHTYTARIDGAEVNTMYVFNQGQERFVIVGADDRCVPIIGYSANGCFKAEDLPINMKSWLTECSESIAAAIVDHAPENETILKRWKELAANKTAAATKDDDDYLLTSTWEQGWGYNKYCPKMDGESVVVGCVATAMAQIIRYHQYPLRGFGYKSYSHTFYGQQAVNFDTTDYDYSLMPDRVRWRSTEEEIDMVSRLCRHCGIVVNMNYQHPGYTEGSGAQTAKVVEGIAHFGYTDAKLMVRTDVNDSMWIATIRNEIANRRPIEYSGHSNGGGHAFVLDGFNSQDEGHFNWGWGGYCDGFYSIHTVMGYSSSQQMVYNIVPSGWDGHLERFYVSADGHDGGTSWEHTNNNISAAVKLNLLVNKDIWIKEGVYYGDTTDQYAYRFRNKATLYGGFSGTETALNQRNANEHPTIFDGRGMHGILSANYFASTNNMLKIYDIVLQNGYSEKGYCVELTKSVLADRMTIRDCRSDSGAVANIHNTSILRRGIFYGNQAPTIVKMYDNSELRQSLVHHNSCQQALNLAEGAIVVNTDIVNNAGIGVVFDNNTNTFANNIVWGCDTSFSSIGNSRVAQYCAIQSDTAFSDSTLIRLDSDNLSENGPHFINPTPFGSAEEPDYHLSLGSICIDAGKRIQEYMADGDLDNNIRCRNGFVDIGCYETNYRVGLDNAERNSFGIYPNPTSSTIILEGFDGNESTVYDMNGRAVMQIHGNRADVSTLASGVYYLRSLGKKAKFVKQ